MVRAQSAHLTPNVYVFIIQAKATWPTLVTFPTVFLGTIGNDMSLFIIVNNDRSYCSSNYGCHGNNILKESPQF